ncbi:MAG: ComF family protein [Lachnospiraceae bacterium]|nr:ComF family protein [Lachnospiraceae bacterium]GFI02102.1 hypothetical protein IMSAGC005_00929 [Lachnospiraceae bacterium]
MAIRERVLDLLFPKRCVVCDEIAGQEGKAVCRRCRDKILYVQEPFCLKCGKQLQHEEQEYCEDCKKNRHLYIQGSALYDYGSMADSIFRFKYAGRMEYADFYGRELYERKAGWLSMVQPDALVPVPIHAARKRKRGYNQAELVARHLSSLCGVPVNNSLIYRPKQTAPLKDLSHSERQNNLKRAFKIRQNDVKLSTIVIIDDIYTTGSTIDAMSEVLHQAGISDVYFMTLTVGRGI